MRPYVDFIVRPAASARGSRPACHVAALWLDPVSIDLDSSDGGTVDYDLETGDFLDDDEDCYVEVGGNVEIIVCAISLFDFFNLRVKEVPGSARDGALFFGPDEELTVSLTEDLRGGVTEFRLGS